MSATDSAAELQFTSRADFRVWLSDNAEIGSGVWLIFGKTKAVKTLTANEALEEALCFGWIDGVMKSIDETKYRKYFAPRRAKSVWSVKNKAAIEKLREKGLMTSLGERAIEIAKENGKWDERTAESQQEQIDFLKDKLVGFPAAHNSFEKLPPSAQLANMRRYTSVKSEEKRAQILADIINELGKE